MQPPADPPDAGLRQLKEHLSRTIPLIETEASARLAVEEIVSHLGERLGFGSRRDEHEDVDVWTSPSGMTIAVRTVPGGDVLDELRVLSRTRDRLLAERGLPARRVSGLCVVCGSMVNWRQIEDAAALRRVADHLRVVSLDALLSLADLRLDQVLSHTDAVTLLRPQSVRADALVELVTRQRRGQTGVKPGSDGGQTMV